MCPSERQQHAGAEPSEDPATTTTEGEEIDAQQQQQQRQQQQQEAAAAAAAEDATPLDPLAAFAVGLAHQQAEARGETGDVDEAFLARALAESRRMRGEATNSQGKRAALAAQIAANHGETGLSSIQAAMKEHQQEVLTQQQLDLVEQQQ